MPSIPEQREYDNNMRGALFRNQNKRSEKSPGLSGPLTITHICPHCTKSDRHEWRLAGWTQTDRKGDKYISLSVTEPLVQQEPETVTEERVEQDEIPF